MQTKWINLTKPNFINQYKNHWSNTIPEEIHEFYPKLKNIRILGILGYTIPKFWVSLAEEYPSSEYPKLKNTLVIFLSRFLSTQL